MSQSPPHKKTKQLEEDSKQAAAEVNPFAAFDFRFLLKTYWGTHHSASNFFAASLIVASPQVLCSL
jgi:hypothetical protein